MTYLDISYNNIQNSGFAHIFTPVSRNRCKLSTLHCRGNGVGGPGADKLLYSISHYLKTLDMAQNQLSETNGAILHDYALGNVWIENINIDGNP